MTTDPFDTSWILKSRGARNQVDPTRPYAFLIEQELSSQRNIEDVATIFLTNRECPFRCLMCDLWKNTTDFSVSSEELIEQLEFALEKLVEDQGIETPLIRQWKLYNSGNFFDIKAISSTAVTRIAELANLHYERGCLSNMVIECHPRLIGNQCLEFKQTLRTDLEVAMGLETIHPKILPRLNKQMTTDDFQRATSLLQENSISVRAFILLKTPFQSESEGLEWTLRSIEWGFQNGVDCCVVIPTRTGNGSLERLKDLGHFEEPQLESLESAFSQGLNLASPDQRLFVDLWDLQRFSSCQHCFDQRRSRLNWMNLHQQVIPELACDVCS